MAKLFSRRKPEPLRLAHLVLLGERELLCGNPRRELTPPPADAPLCRFCANELMRLHKQLNKTLDEIHRMSRR